MICAVQMCLNVKTFSTVLKARLLQKSPERDRDVDSKAVLALSYEGPRRQRLKQA